MRLLAFSLAWCVIAGFKGLVAQTGADGIALAKAFLPNAVTLDIGLPDMDWFRCTGNAQNGCGYQRDSRTCDVG